MVCVFVQREILFEAKAERLVGCPVLVVPKPTIFHLTANNTSNSLDVETFYSGDVRHLRHPVDCGSGQAGRGAALSRPPLKHSSAVPQQHDPSAAPPRDSALPSRRVSVSCSPAQLRARRLCKEPAAMTTCRNRSRAALGCDVSGPSHAANPVRSAGIGGGPRSGHYGVCARRFHPPSVFSRPGLPRSPPCVRRGDLYLVRALSEKSAERRAG